jgi:hypothetical protein
MHSWLTYIAPAALTAVALTVWLRGTLQRRKARRERTSWLEFERECRKRAEAESRAPLRVVRETPDGMLVERDGEFMIVPRETTRKPTEERA